MKLRIAESRKSAKFWNEFRPVRQLFFSATPFHNLDEFCYFSSKLTGKSVHQVKSEITATKDLHPAVSDLLRQITSSGGMVHREFPFYGKVLAPELLPLALNRERQKGS